MYACDPKLSSRGGVFIVVEGIDGAGKTLHSKKLCISLHRKGYDVRYTAEPSKNYLGRIVREEFLHRTKILPEMETLLFAADRFQHVQEEILPSLQQSRIVVSDRYYFASIAYQGAQGVSTDWIRSVNNFAPRPDLVMYLDVPADIAIARIRRDKSLMERLDLEEKVRALYLELVKSGELILVDGNRSIETVSEEMLRLVLEVISKTRQKSSDKVQQESS
jgi:dTMP kinase